MHHQVVVATVHPPGTSPVPVQLAWVPGGAGDGCSATLQLVTLPLGAVKLKMADE